METLTVQDVLRIHEILEQDFTGTTDPVSPPGVKSMALLESAVHRQFSGHGETLKYPEPIGNAATLTFGICLDHAFHNGNKRTALVAMLVHLDKNHLSLRDTAQSDLYQLMLGIADHSLGIRTDPRRPDRARPRRHADEEVAAVRSWLRDRAVKIRRGERPISFRQLRRILSSFDYEVEASGANSVNVIKVVTSQGLFSRRPRITRTRIGSIGYRDEGTEVSIKDLKSVRKMCSLRESDGVDTNSFYDGAEVVDVFVNRYRTVLRRLART